MTSRLRRLSMALSCLLLALACSDGFPPEFPAEDFMLKSPLTGNQVSLADIKGKPTIIYWFTSW